MTADREAAIRARHFCAGNTPAGICDADLLYWPCDTEVMRRAADAARAERDALAKALAEAACRNCRHAYRSHDGAERCRLHGCQCPGWLSPDRTFITMMETLA